MPKVCGEKSVLQSGQKGKKGPKYLFITMVTRYVPCTSRFQTVHSQLNFENIQKNKTRASDKFNNLPYQFQGKTRTPKLEVCRGEAHVFQATRVLQHSFVNQVFAKAHLDIFISQKSNYVSPHHQY